MSSRPSIGPTVGDDEPIDVVVKGPRYETVPVGMWEITDGMDVRVWLRLRSLGRSRPGTDSGQQRASVETIRQKLLDSKTGRPVSAATVRRSLDRLEAAGYIRRVRARRADGSLGVYRFIVLWVEGGADDQPSATKHGDDLRDHSANLHTGPDQGEQPETAGGDQCADLHAGPALKYERTYSIQGAPPLDQTPPAPRDRSRPPQPRAGEEEGANGTTTTPTAAAAEAAAAIRGELQQQHPTVNWAGTGRRWLRDLAAAVDVLGAERCRAIARNGHPPNHAAGFTSRWKAAAEAAAAAPAPRARQRCDEHSTWHFGTCPGCRAESLTVLGREGATA